jgi:hypothetical protein
MIDSWAISYNWYPSEVEDLKLCLPRGGHPTSASGWATVGRRRVETTSMSSSARRWAITVGRSDVDRTTRRCHRQERWCRGAVPGVSWRSSSGRVCVKESWVCKFAHRVDVKSVSPRCVQVILWGSIAVEAYHVVLSISARCDRGSWQEDVDAPYVDKD